MSLFYRLRRIAWVISNVWPWRRAHRASMREWFWLLRRTRYSFLIIILVCPIGRSPLLAGDVNGRRGALTLVNRSIAQDQGAWIVDYRLRYTHKTGVIITPDALAVRTEGWVSNSRVPSHALPRWSSLFISHSPDLSAVSDLVMTAEEAERCRERLTVSVWTEDDKPLTASRPIPNDPTLKRSEPTAVGMNNPMTVLPFSLGPDAIVRVRLRFEHDHILYGEYDPLLSMRSVMLTIGSISVSDVILLDREQYMAQPKFTWPEPPEDRRDTRHSVSGPDSLHLEADVPGHQYYRYVERPVRYSTQMRLRFWYLIAAGTEGDCKVRVAQSKETPIAWRMLNNGLIEQCLKTVGRWTKFERVIQIEAEATKLTLEFKIVGDTEVGEMWIDDVSLEPVGSEGLRGP
jgi:hypothetical protein